MRITFLIIITCFSLVASAQNGAMDSSLNKMMKIIPGADVSFELVLIPGGEYTMGSEVDEEIRDEDEGPRFEVKIDSFWMGAYEVTYDEYTIFREKDLDLATDTLTQWNADAVARPSPPYEDPTFGMGEEGFPAVSMTQFAALQYCKWLSDKTGDFYRLPTEAEWEYACRGGNNDHDNFDSVKENINDLAWYYDNSMEKYHKVGLKLPNNYGLYDILGNAAEWTLDQYEKDAYAIMATKMPDVINPWIKPTRLHPRSVRGGSWDDRIEENRCTARIRSNMKWKERDPQIPKSFWWNTDSPFVGFRIVRPFQQPTPEEQAEFWAYVLGD